LPRPKDEDSVEHELVKKYNDSIRELVIAPKGYKFIDDDYESLEPRCFADDAGDEALIRIFTDNLDMYSVVAIMAEDIKDASADKKAPNFLKKKYPNVRQNAKAYALGIRYGMKEFKLAKSLDISEEKAAEIIKNYFKAFPGLKAKMDKYLVEVKTTGKVTSKFGRVRHLPRAKEIYQKFGDGILDFRNLKKISMKTGVAMDELRLIRKEYNNLLNNALNFPIQSAATSIVNRAAIAMTKKFIENKIDAWVSLQIHDQLVATCKEETCGEAKEVVQYAMEKTNELTMPLVAKPEIAGNLREGH
jgi:DNA polymerase-1